MGAGIAGLIAAIESAERGAPVRVLEARSHLGGRARSTPPPYIANLGPHALYIGGPLWDWLIDRDLAPPTSTPGDLPIRVRWRDEIFDSVPPAVLAGIRQLGPHAPNDQTFRAWSTAACGDEPARAIAGLAGNLTFDHDPGRLAADFVWQRMRRITLAGPGSSRYVIDGWSALIKLLGQRAHDLGVTLQCGAKVADVDTLDEGAVIVAVAPGAARRLLRDPSLRVESPAVALLDVAIERRANDPYLVVDLDDAAFADRFTAVVPSLAPDRVELVQACVGLRPGEALDSGEARLERLLDSTFDGWRERLRWRRRGVVRESTGALQLPGTSWQDRPSVGYRPGVWLAGDWVASEGHLAEVSCASAVTAARAAVEQAVRSW